jgi:hypothetical protein
VFSLCGLACPVGRLVREAAQQDVDMGFEERCTV